MKHQIHIGTELGIVSKEAVNQITTLITDLNRSARTLDAAIRVTMKRPRADDLEIATALETRRNNLIATIAALEDHLESVEKMRSRGYGVPVFHPTHATPSRFALSVGPI